MDEGNVWTPYEKEISKLIEEHDEKKEDCLVLPIFDKKYSIYKGRRQQVNNFDLSSKPREILRGTWFYFEQNDSYARQEPKLVPYTERLSEYLEKEYQITLKENSFSKQKIIDLTNKTHFIVFHSKDDILRYSYSQFKKEHHYDKEIKENGETKLFKCYDYSIKETFPGRMIDWKNDKIDQHASPFTVGIQVKRGYNPQPNFSNNLEWRWFYHAESLHQSENKTKSSAAHWKPFSLHNTLLLDFQREKGNQKTTLFNDLLLKSIEADFQKEMITCEYTDVYDSNKIKIVSLPIRRSCWFWIDSDDMLRDVLYPLRENICNKLNEMAEKKEFDVNLDLDEKKKRYCFLTSQNCGKQKIYNHENFEWRVVKGHLPSFLYLFEKNLNKN
eukprot:gene1547-12673_t